MGIIDREKVIKGLEKVVGFFEARGDMAVGDGKMLLLSWMRAAEDAITLLKAQEPRVMTISDFKDGGVYYLEALPPFMLRPVIYRLDHSDPRHCNFVWKYDQFTWNTGWRTWEGERWMT